jgi:hypothetical protein
MGVAAARGALDATVSCALAVHDIARFVRNA